MKTKNPFNEQRKKNIDFMSELIYVSGNAGIKSIKLLALVSKECGVTLKTSVDYAQILEDAEIIEKDENFIYRTNTISKPKKPKEKKK